MNGTKETAIKKTAVLVSASAMLLAIVFVLADLFPGFVRDAALGAIVGALAGSMVCLMVSVMERELVHQGRIDTTSRMACNVIIGVSTGVIAISTAITILIPALGLTTSLSPGPIPWGVLVAALLGLPLGALVGGLIGASWRWL